MLSLSVLFEELVLRSLRASLLTKCTGMSPLVLLRDRFCNHSFSVLVLYFGVELQHSAVAGTHLTWELKQPRRRRRQKPHKFAYLSMKNSSFARYARVFFICKNFADVLALPRLEMTCFGDLFRVESICYQMFNFVFLPLKRWFQFNSRIVKTYFASVMTLNN